jgi:hypothetical protein
MYFPLPFETECKEDQAKCTAYLIKCIAAGIVGQVDNARG